jgi:phage-related holin
MRLEQLASHKPIGFEMDIKVWIAAIIGIFAPVHAIMLAAGFLIFADLATGMMAAKKRGEKISSAAMRRTVSKILVYQLVIMSGFLVETYMIGGAIPISKIAASIIGMTELFSILENAEQIYGQPIFKKLLRALGSENDKK